MATTFTTSDVTKYGCEAPSVIWAALGSAETGDAYEFAGSGDRSVQVDGTFGAAVTIQGSNDGTTYYTLTDPDGNALSFTANALEQVLEITRYIRPAKGVAAGTVKVTIFTRLAAKR